MNEELTVAAIEILFRGIIKKFKLKKIKKKLEYIELDKKKKTWFFTISFYKFSNFELLHDSSLWVFIANMGSYDYFI